MLGAGQKTLRNRPSACTGDPGPRSKQGIPSRTSARRVDTNAIGTAAAPCTRAHCMVMMRHLSIFVQVVSSAICQNIHAPPARKPHLMLYAVNEKALCFHGPLIYQAKVCASEGNLHSALLQQIDPLVLPCARSAFTQASR